MKFKINVGILCLKAGGKKWWSIEDRLRYGSDFFTYRIESDGRSPEFSDGFVVTKQSDIDDCQLILNEFDKLLVEIHNDGFNKLNINDFEIVEINC